MHSIKVSWFTSDSNYCYQHIFFNREVRTELDQLMQKKLNRLGASVEQRAENMNNLKTNPSLVLK